MSRLAPGSRNRDWLAWLHHRRAWWSTHRFPDTGVVRQTEDTTQRQTEGGVLRYTEGAL